MKHKVLTLLSLVAALTWFASCTDDEMPAIVQQPLQVRLNVSLDGYEGTATRAGSLTFADAARVYILLQQDAQQVPAVAVYDAKDKAWSLTADGTLADTDSGTCQLAYFDGNSSVGSQTVTLTAQTGVYTTSAATYQLSDGLLTVSGRMTPLLGRIRFAGEAGQAASFTGMQVPATFSLATHELTLSAQAVSTTVAADGFTPYTYGAFANATERRLRFAVDEATSLVRSFGTEVLAAGQSGYMNLPAVGSQGWTLVDNTTGQEVVRAALSAVTISDVASTEATATCTIVSNGNAVTDAGFVYSTARDVQLTDNKISLGAQAQSITTRFAGLQPGTTYYVRAYATTASGTTMSAVADFTTRPDMVGRALVAYYTFDNQTCDNVRSDNYHGVLVGNGSYITDTPNKQGRSLSLLQQQYVNIPYMPVTGNAWTISMWVKDFGTGILLTGIKDGQYINCPSLFVSASGIPQTTFNSSSSLVSLNLSLSSYQTGVWTHLALSMNNGLATLYVNGKRFATKQIGQGAAAGQSIIVGGRPSTSWAWSDPMIVDNVRLHGAVLTDDEVASIYQYEK